MKVVINCDFGGFGLSDQAFEMFMDRKQIKWEKVINKYGDSDYFHAGHVDDQEYYLSHYDLIESRSDPDLIAVVEELGVYANGRYAELKIVEIPDDIKWHIEDYDGRECIAEDHRRWE